MILLIFVFVVVVRFLVSVMSDVASRFRMAMQLLL